MSEANETKVKSASVAAQEAKELWEIWNEMTLEGRRAFARQFHSHFPTIGHIEKMGKTTSNVNSAWE